MQREESARRNQAQRARALRDATRSQRHGSARGSPRGPWKTRSWSRTRAEKVFFSTNSDLISAVLLIGTEEEKKRFRLRVT